MTKSTGYCVGATNSDPVLTRKSKAADPNWPYENNALFDELLEEIFFFQQQMGNAAIGSVNYLAHKGKFQVVSFTLNHDRAAIIYFDTSIDRMYSVHSKDWPVFAVIMDTAQDTLTFLTNYHKFSWDMDYHDTLTMRVAYMLDKHGSDFLELWHYICGYTYGMSGVDLRAACAWDMFWFTDAFGSVVEPEPDDGEMTECDPNDNSGHDETYAIKC